MYSKEVKRMYSKEVKRMYSKEVNRRIKECIDSKSTHLNLTSCNLTEIPNNLPDNLLSEL
jgi:hypothetical protein